VVNLVNQFNKDRHRAAHEALSSIKITKSLNLEKYFLNVTKGCEEYTSYQSFAKLIAEIPGFVIGVTRFSAIIVVIIVLIIRGYEIESFIPTVSLFAFAGYRLMPSLSKIFRAAINLFHNQPILEKVYNDMVNLSATGVDNLSQDELNVFEEKGQIQSSIEFNHCLTLDHIDFYYKDSNKIIDQLTLTVNKNSIVGFAGTTGAGKPR